MTLSYLRRKKRLSTTLPSAQSATYFKSVSSLARPYRSRITLVATTNAATCTIIHSDRLYTDFFALKHATPNPSSPLQLTTTLTKNVYSFSAALRNAWKLNEVD